MTLPRLALSRGALVALGAMLGAFTACASAPKTALPPRDVDRLASEYIRSLDTRALKGDLDAILEKWADDLDHTVSLASVRNKEELRTFLETWSGIFPQWKHIETRRLIQGNVVAWEGIATGLHRTTGKTLELPMVMILEFDGDGKVKMSHVYFDQGVLQQQLLAEP